jgi:hypothetical protein
MKALAIGALAAAAATLAIAPAPAQQRERISQLVIYGNDPCPRSSTGEEIVICARRPESERYRVPRELRSNRAGRDNLSWAARAQSLEYVGRSGIGSCSTSGPGGITGCWEQMMRQARAEREQGLTPR